MNLTIEFDQQVLPHMVIVTVGVSGETNVQVNPEPQAEALAALHPEIAEAIVSAVESGGRS